MDGIIDVKQIDFKDMLARFNTEHNQEVGSNKWSYGYFYECNETFGNWYDAKISRDLVYKTILPAHTHEKDMKKSSKGKANSLNTKIKSDTLYFIIKQLYLRSRFQIVSRFGSPVEETYNHIKKHEEEFIRKCPTCVETMRHFNGKELRTIILTQKPLFTITPFNTMTRWNDSHLVLLDGFHRLLSLLYPKKIEFDYIRVCIAAHENFLPDISN